MRSPSASRCLPTLRLLAAAVLLAGGALIATKPAQALSALDDSELAQVSGRAAPPGQEQAQDLTKRLPFVGGLLGLLSLQQGKTSMLDRAAFEAALAAHGMNPLPTSLYDGQPVTQIVVDGPPVSVQMNAGAFLLSSVGINPASYHGASFGTVNIINFDARGTTLWVWPH